MNNIMEKNGILTLDSRDVAEMTGKQHKDLLESIRGYIQHLVSGNFRPSDFFVESTYTDNLNREKPCYLLTRKGCDMVANKMTGEKGVIFTATYVTKFEEMEKEIQAPMQQLSPQLQLLISMELEQNKLKQQLNEVNNKVLMAKAEAEGTKQEVQAIRDVITLNPNSWRTEVANMLNKIAKERGGTQEAYREIRNESYKLLDERAGAKLEIRLTNRRRKVLEETGSKSKAEKVSKLDVIGDDKRLTEIYLAIVKEMAIKYKVA